MTTTTTKFIGHDHYQWFVKFTQYSFIRLVQFQDTDQNLFPRTQVYQAKYTCIWRILCQGQCMMWAVMTQFIILIALIKTYYDSTMGNIFSFWLPFYPLVNGELRDQVPKTFKRVCSMEFKYQAKRKWQFLFEPCFLLMSQPRCGLHLIKH